MARHRLGRWGRVVDAVKAWFGFPTSGLVRTVSLTADPAPLPRCKSDDWNADLQTVDLSAMIPVSVIPPRLNTVAFRAPREAVVRPLVGLDLRSRLKRAAEAPLFAEVAASLGLAWELGVAA